MTNSEFRYSTFRFTLNMHNHRSQVAIPVFLGDTGVRLLINLTDGGNPYFIADGCTAYIRGKKPDEKGIFNQCLILNNTTIQYDFTEQTSNYEGITTCELEIYSPGPDGKLITAPKFIIVVDSRSLSDSEIAAIIGESTSEIGLIPQIQNVFASEEERVEAEEVRKANEITREANEANRRALYEGVKTFDTRISENTRRITNLENKALSFVTDTNVAHIKEVPENALPYALISKIGGMSKKSKNLLNFDLWSKNIGVEGGTKSINGNAITITATSSDCYTSYNDWKDEMKIPVKQGERIIFSWKTDRSDVTGNVFIFGNGGTTSMVSVNSNNSVVGYDVPEGITFITCRIGVGGTGNSLTYSELQIEKSSVKTEYEPFFEGIRDAKVTAGKSVGANLITQSGDVSSLNGVTFTKNADGSITVNGTATKQAYNTMKIKNLPNGTYSFNITRNGNSTAYVYISFTDGTGKSVRDGHSSFTITDSKKLQYAILNVGSGAIVSNETWYVMLNNGDTPLPYTPYTEHTLAIPEAVQSLEGYGQSNPNNADEYNYIDLVNGKFNSCGHIVDGEWVAYDSKQETDIDIDGFISVEGGGTLEFVNEHGYDVPSEIYYQLEGVTV